MENIVEPNETFDFFKLSLAHPIGIQGGAYFTKIEYNKKPLYIQTTKGQSKQGFIKTGKKYYIDLMFDKNAESLIQWFENLETKCQSLIFERRDTWFQNGLEESDIESAFNSTIRIYKSGKLYLLRTNIKNNHNNTPAVKIYNEQQIPLNISDVTNETNIISILEIQGIKFTTRNFQIEIELKQIMVLDNEILFDSCLIKSSNQNKPQYNNTIDNTYEVPLAEDIKLDEFLIEDESNITNNNNTRHLIEEQNMDDDLEEINHLESFDEKKPIDEKKPFEESKEDTIFLDVEELEENIEESNNDLREIDNIDLSLENNLNVSIPIHLKKPNQVYFELYKEARNKAKIAKKNAILAYLEAKNIKKTYMLESLVDSDSDFDAEIDEVSESELEGF
jgi:hypothetical protein